MTRRYLLAGLTAAYDCAAQTAERKAPESTRKLELVDVTVGEYSTSMRLPEGFEFASGMPVFLSFRAAGFNFDPEFAVVSLDYSVAVFDSAGNPFDQPVTGRFVRRFSPDDQSYLPHIQIKVIVPDFICPGDATFKIRMTDRRSKQTVNGGGVIPIRSGFPKTSGTFEILNLKLYRIENDETTVDEPVFKPGDAIWTRFLLASFRWKEREYDLRYGLTVLGKDGRVVLSVPEAAAERNTSEYLRSYVPCLASVRLERSARPGPYSLVISATDGFAKAEAKITVPFQIVPLK